MNGMKEKGDKGKPTPKQVERKEKTELPGYTEYPPNEDIYDKSKEEESIDPEDISKTKELVEKSKRGKKNEKDFKEDKSGGDLDVPGSELDDEEEKAGNEDEENNYYSIGGDDHDDLDEDKGD
jgi:hypothetical protein